MARLHYVPHRRYLVTESAEATGQLAIVPRQLRLPPPESGSS